LHEREPRAVDDVLHVVATTVGGRELAPKSGERRAGEDLVEGRLHQAQVQLGSATACRAGDERVERSDDVGVRVDEPLPVERPHDDHDRAMAVSGARRA
jgi:hypothetical protein